VLDLIGVTAKIFICHIDIVNELEPSYLIELYCFVRLVDKIEIMVELKKAVVSRIHR